MLKKLNTLMLLLLGCIFLSCDKDSSTTPAIKDASDIVGTWYQSTTDYYYDNEKIPVNVAEKYCYFLTSGSSSYGQDIYDVSENGPEFYFDLGIIFKEDGTATFWSEEGIHDEDFPLRWSFQNGQVLMVAADAPDKESYLFTISGGNLCMTYGTYKCKGYYISDHEIDSPETDIDFWSGRDGNVHELKEVYVFSKQ